MNPVLRKSLAAAGAAVRRYGWLPLAVFLLHEGCAHLVDGYRRWPAIDVPLHFLGGFAIAYFAGGGLRTFCDHRLVRAPDAPLQLLLSFALVNTVAVSWEFGEFVSDRLVGTAFQLGLADTLLDLFMGMLGGLAYLLPQVPAALRNHLLPAPETPP